MCHLASLSWAIVVWNRLTMTFSFQFWILTSLTALVLQGLSHHSLIAYGPLYINVFQILMSFLMFSVSESSSLSASPVSASPPKVGWFSWVTTALYRASDSELDGWFTTTPCLIYPSFHNGCNTNLHINHWGQRSFCFVIIESEKKISMLMEISWSFNCKLAHICIQWGDITWALWHLKSLATRAFVQELIQTNDNNNNNNKKSSFYVTVPLWVKSTLLLKLW